MSQRNRLLSRREFVQLSLAATAASAFGVDLTLAFLHRTRLKERFLYWEAYELKFFQAVRWGKWKAIRFELTGPIELYNLQTDVREEHNIADANPSVVARIEGYLRTARTDSAEYSLH